MNGIGIFSLEADLHAHSIQHEIRQLGATCYFFATDSQIEDGGLNWDCQDQSKTFLIDYGRNAVNIATLSLVWWRRANQPQKNPETFPGSTTFEFVSNEWKSAMFGLVSDSFTGTWVNDPSSDVLAGNKLFQLTQAKEAGFVVPETLVSNSPSAIKDFMARCSGTVVVKKLLGSASQALATVELHEGDLDSSNDRLRISPAIYQQRIVSGRHIRAHCFGTAVYSVLIESEDLDWRRNLNCRFSEFTLDTDVSAKLIRLVDGLGLRMAVVDLIQTEHDTIFLEVNPQGQFLFADGLSGVNLRRPFAEYLISLSERGDVQQQVPVDGPRAARSARR